MPSSTPRPGAPVRGSRRGKPIMALFDLLGRSWALGIVWQLSAGPLTFRQLQERCETLSPTVLNTRLKELRESAIIAHDGDGYRLTELGAELFALIRPFEGWSRRWAQALARAER